MRVLYFGTYDRAHPRNVNAIAALRLAGAEIEERQVPVRGSGLIGAFNVFAAEWRLLAPRRARLRPRDRRLPRPLRRPPRPAPREEAPARVRCRPVARERARRRAPPLSRPVDGGNRSSRRRLPRFPPAGSRRLRHRRGSPPPVAARSQADGRRLPRRRRGHLLRDLVADVPVHGTADRRCVGGGRTGCGHAGRDAGSRCRSERDLARLTRDRARARRHRARRVSRVAGDPGRRLRGARHGRAGDHGRHRGRPRAAHRR